MWHPDVVDQIGSTWVLILIQLPIVLAFYLPLRRVVKGKW